MGFLTKLDTNGTRADVLERLIAAGLLDYVAMDFKSALDSESFLQVSRCRRPALLENIRSSIAILKDSGLDHEFRTTVVPTPDFESKLPVMAEYIADAPRWFLQKMRPQRALTPRFQAYPELDDEYLHNLRDTLLPIMPNCAVRG